MKNVILIVALPSEFKEEDLAFEIPVIYSGVGKLNAAHATQEALRLHNPDLVINLGTAGAISRNPGELLEVCEVFQRDMDARPLVPRGEIPFQSSSKTFTSDFGTFKCGTGDSFVTEVDPWFLENNIEIIDMELYGIAFICDKYSVQWRSIKYITDNIGSDSGDEWIKQLKQSSHSLHQILPTLL